MTTKTLNEHLEGKTLSSVEEMTVQQCLAAAQKIWENPKRNTKGVIGGNPYKYANLVQVLELVQTYLVEPYGCSHSQAVSVVPIPGVTSKESPAFLAIVTTTLWGPVGDTITAMTSLPVVGYVTRKADSPVRIAPTPQESGSAISYARRYGWLGVLDLAQEDDDGAHASQQGPAPAAAASPAQTHPEPTYPYLARNSKGDSRDEYKFSLFVKGSHKPGDVVDGVVSTRTGAVSSLKLVGIIARPHRGVEEWAFAVVEEPKS